MSARGRRPSICFVAHFAYGAVAGDARGHIGGVERQAALMSRWFADRGHAVSVVTWDEGQPDGLVISGVRIITLCRRDRGWPGVRFVHPRWTSLVSALRAADADVYYQNCGEYVTGQVALWCRWAGRRFVYSVASDADCDPRLPEMTLRERLLYRYGLRHADRVVVQTRTQARSLRQGFGRAAVVIPMPALDMSDPASAGAAGDRSGHVLWIGRLAHVKRPDRLLDLAEACPDLRVDLVGPTDGTPYARGVVDRARGLPNVTVHGRATMSEVRAFIGGALCLVSTSEYEGFPNTFLEAWSAGLPVISIVDPDETIRSFELGAVAPDVRGLALAVRRLASSPSWRRAISERARRYFVEHHGVDRALPRFARLFAEVAGSHENAEPRAQVIGATR
jgi:glycosyltransferase involved in cell wall biosynthesis